MLKLFITKFVFLIIFIVKLDLLAAQLKKTWVCICMEELSSNLDDPLIIQNAGDGTERLFVGEQKGVIHILNQNGVKSTKPFLNLTDKVLNGGERGLLGLAFHPNFKKNRRFFVYYSSRAKPKNSSDDHVARLCEFSVSRQNPGIADKSSEKLIMEIQQPFSNHNGGEIIFGDDSYLYIFLGDGGSGGDPRGFAQNTLSLLGKVLRIDINKIGSRRGYVIPPDNPFIRKRRTFRPEIYAYGVRNIWRCGKESGKKNGRIMCGDVGQNRFEEIDLLQKGANYGWNDREGFECFKNKTCGKTGPEVKPVFAYSHDIGSSVIGGQFYSGCLNPRLRRFYIFGDFMNGKLFRLFEKPRKKKWNGRELRLCDSTLCSPPLTNTYESYITSFGLDESGEVYMVARGGTNSGKLYRIVDPVRNGDPRKCKAAKALQTKRKYLKKG
ncbi:HHIP-like protein 2 isoform X1 [Mytilus californianus]|uniref:HHIP-like protein 2 isoform X1 n=1 Tax=Mytilus californianus TaxID=6549 RepID=UPI0022462F57|nr:HHIP-like protein 2 isoform X1 [Mytilus californianus]